MNYKKSPYKDLLRDDFDFKTAERLQIKYSKISSEISNQSQSLVESDFKIVVGVDVHYFKKSERGIACAIFWDKDKKKVIDSSYATMKINMPYKPGFLGFREAKIISHAIRESKIKADLLMCDGHGIIHPRFFGEAVHLGFALQIPSLGVAKNPFIGFSSWKSMERIRGKKTPIWLEDPNHNNSNNTIIGYAICLADSKKPVFVSTGYRISLQTSIKLTLSTTTSNRQPEPLFLADKYARSFERL